MLQVLTVGGSWSGGTSVKNGEIFDPNAGTWTLLPGVPAEPIYTNDPGGKYRADNHAWLFGWSGGRGALCCCAVWFDDADAPAPLRFAAVPHGVLSRTRFRHCACASCTSALLLHQATRAKFY